MAGLCILNAKRSSVTLAVLSIFIVGTIWYSAVVYKAPDTFKGQPAYIEHILDLPQGTWVLSFYSDFHSYITIWVIKPGDEMPMCYYMKWDESFMTKLNKTKAEAERSGGFIRINKGGQSRNDRGGTNESDSRNDVEIIDPREVLTKE